MAKLKLIESTDKFLMILERSGLLEEKQLAAVKKVAETSEDPIQVAKAILKKGWLTKWQASQLLSGFYHLTIGKYRLSEHLGKGELGSVYLAENPKLGRKVALKTLSKQFTRDPELVKRFLAEASAAAALDHRNIVHIHDVSSEGERHYVVMEYVTGRDLQTRVDEDGTLSFDEATSFIRQAAEGLQFAHDQGVIHRDIKPANVMLDEHGVVKILDIGVGQLRQSGKDLSENTGEMMMSAVAYMAPEHAREKEIDARSDVYSLGGVLYFALTGRVPFSSESDEESAKIKETKQPIPLAQLRSDVPEGLADVCKRMLALKPDERFASMKELLAALGTIGSESLGAATDDEVEELAADEPLEVEMDDAEIAEVEPDDESDEAAEIVAADKPAAGGISIDTGKDSPPAGAIAPTDFAINTKRRKKKKPATAAATEEPAKQAEPAKQPAGAGDEKPEPAKQVDGKPGLPKAVIFGGVGIAALVLLAAIGGGVMMLLGGGDTEVAEGPTPGAAPASAGESPTETAEDMPEVAASDDAMASDPVTDAVPTDSATTDAASEGEPTEPNPPTEAPAASIAKVPAADAATPAPAAATPAEDAPPASETPAVTASETTPAEPMGDATAPDKPAEPEVTEPKPEPEAKPEEPKPKPAPKPEPKPAPPKKKVPPKPRTFVFKPAIDLPTPAADAPEITLGQINIRPEDAVFISLDGGDIAASGKIEFALQNAQDGVAPRDWEFYLSDGNADPIVVATMSLPEKDLKFKWTSAGVENATATNLRNCSLKITAGQDKPQDLALRTPQTVPPSTIDLERSATIKLPLEGAPDRSSLKMEITVKGHKAMVEPGQIELAKNGGAYIYFGENREQAALALKIDATVNARGVQIKTDPYFMVPVETSPVRLNKGSMKKYESAGEQLGLMQNQILQGEKMSSDKKVPEPQRRAMQARLAQMKQQAAVVEQTATKMNQLKVDMAAVGAGAALQFRVFSDTFEKQIDLVVTDSKAAPVAP